MFLGGISLILVSFIWIPVFPLMPEKLAAFFNMGSVLILCSFAVLRGFKAYCIDQFLCGPTGWIAFLYLCSLMFCIWASAIESDYIWTIIGLVVELLLLLYLACSQFPGG
mmetsp:Transcript_12226/g.16907  ORF Transcript_12226/g.16907 Transcript_12226/m.16907 type:complete len:110 (+) Transcript_12226:507-836(+)